MSGRTAHTYRERERERERERRHTDTHLVQKQIFWNLPANGSNAWRLQEQR
jgi:hypothetical protein